VRGNSTTQEETHLNQEDLSSIQQNSPQRNVTVVITNEQGKVCLVSCGVVHKDETIVTPLQHLPNKTNTKSTEIVQLS